MVPRVQSSTRVAQGNLLEWCKLYLKNADQKKKHLSSGNSARRANQRKPSWNLFKNKCSPAQNRFLICIFSTFNSVTIFYFKIIVSLKCSMHLYHFGLPGWRTSRQWGLSASECAILFSCASEPFYFSLATRNQSLGFLNLGVCVCARQSASYLFHATRK